MAPLSIGAAAILLDLPLLRCGMVLEDEGTTMELAARMARGDVLYRDLPINLGPGVYELLALAFRVAGPSYLLARLLVSGAAAATAALLYLAARRAAPGPGALLAPAMFLILRPYAFPSWHMVMYTPFAMALALGSLVLLMAEEPRAFECLAAGLCAGVSTAFKQNFGAIAILAGCGALALGRASRGRYARFIAGALAPLAALALLYAGRGAFAPFFQWTVVFALGTGQVFHVPPPPLLPTLRPDEAFRSGLYYYAPPLFLGSVFQGIAGSVLWRQTGLVEDALKACFAIPFAAPPLLFVFPGQGAASRPVRALSLFALLFLALGSYPSADWAHLCYALPPAFAVFAALLSRARWMRVTALVATTIATAVTIPFTMRALAPYSYRLERVGLVVPEGFGRPLEEAASILRRRGAREVVVAPYQPGFYHLSGCANPTNTTVFLPRFVGPQELEQVEQALDRKTLVVRFRKEYAHLLPFARSFPEIERRLEGPPLALFSGDGFEVRIVEPAPRRKLP